MKHKITWIIVADAASARVYEATKATGPVHEVLQVGHPDSRERERDILSDRPGRSWGAGGTGRHAFEPHADPLEVEAQRFAAELGSLLRQHRLNGSYQRLYLVAEPHFLGLLRRALDEETHALVVGEINKDLTHLKKAHEIREYLPERL